MIAFAQIFNDILDYQLDLRHKPYRPIPAGRISMAAAELLAVGFAAIALIAAIVTGTPTALLCLVCLFLGALYSLRLKDTVVIGNVTVAAVSALTLPYGIISLAPINVRETLRCILVFVLILGNEFFKTGLDIEGDSAQGIRTLATVLGLSAVAIGIDLSVILLVAVDLTIFALEPAERTFSICILVGVAIPAIIAAALAIPHKLTQSTLVRGNFYWSIGWLPAIIAFALL